MNITRQNIDSFVSGVEESVAKRYRDIHTTQSFNGTLRVKLDSVYVNKSDGERAIAHLRKLKMLGPKAK